MDFQQRTDLDHGAAKRIADSRIVLLKISITLKWFLEHRERVGMRGFRLPSCFPNSKKIRKTGIQEAGM